MNINLLLKSLYIVHPEIALSISIFVLLATYLAFPKSKMLIRGLALAAVAVTAGFVLVNYGLVQSLITVEKGSPLLVTDPFGSFFKIAILLSTAIIFLFSFDSDELKEADNIYGEYYILILGMVLGMMVFVSSTDLIVLYLAMEVMSLLSYILAGYLRTDLRSSEASLKYLIYGAVASGIMLFGISLVFGLSGSTNYLIIGDVFRHGVNASPILLVASLMILAGFTYKLSAVPFHYWAPDVFEGAPVTFTAYLSVASKAAALAGLVRFLYLVFTSGTVGESWILSSVVNIKQILILLAVITMTVGNFSALWQNNLKRMLAYSGIAHIGYMLSAIAILGNQAIYATLFYFFVYMLSNLGAFHIVSILKNKYNSENLSDLAGAGYKLPVLGATLTIFLVSLTGLPPTAGFVGKLQLFLGLFDAKLSYLALIALVNTVISLYFYMKVLKALYFDKPEKDVEVTKSSVTENVITVLLAAPILLFGVFYTPLVEFVKASITMFK